MFTEETINFLVENRLQNSKTWFEEHRADYRQYVLNPLIELVIALAPTMLSIDDKLICEPKVDKAISRIYRDTRFSKDKSRYRDVMWCGFMRNKKLYKGLPGFFFEFSPNGFRYGCGYYIAGTDSMESMRELVLENDPDFKKALFTYNKQDIFGMEGECYKKSKHPAEPENIRDWLDRKNICFIHDSTDSTLLFSDKLADRLAADYKILQPIYKFLLKAEARKTG